VVDPFRMTGPWQANAKVVCAPGQFGQDACGPRVPAVPLSREAVGDLCEGTGRVESGSRHRKSEVHSPVSDVTIQHSRFRSTCGARSKIANSNYWAGEW